MRDVLRIPAFRRVFVGQLLSATGSKASLVVLVWLSWSLTGTAFASGAVVTLMTLPSILMMGAAGSAGNRFPPLTVLRAGQLMVSVVLASTAAALVVWESPLVLYVSALVTGTITALTNPSRTSLLVELSEGQVDDAMRANSFTFNISALVGPTIGGALIPVVGGYGVLFLSAAMVGSFFIVLLTVSPRMRGDVTHGDHTGLRELLSGDRELLHAVVVVSVIGVLYLYFPLPFVDLVGGTFGGSSVWYGALATTTGAGSVIGALILSKVFKEMTVNTIYLSGAGIGVVSVLIGMSPKLWMIVVLGFVVGLFSVTYYTSASSVLIKLAGPSGRVSIMALYFAVTAGIPAKLLVGLTADMWGGRAPFLVMGGALSAAVALMWLSRSTSRERVKAI